MAEEYSPDKKPVTESSAELLLSQMQMRVHGLLERFLGGGIIPALGRWFYPMGFASRGTLALLRESLTLLQDHGGEATMLFPRFEAFLSSLSRRRRLTVGDIAVILSSFYTDLEELPRWLSPGPETLVASPSQLDLAEYESCADAEYLRPLVELTRFARRYLAEYVKGLYLHGSLSTMDYVRGFSDVDTLLILRANVARDPKLLQATRHRTMRSLPYFCMIDPLQHHGHFVITEQDMQYYPQALFPLVLFGYSKSLLRGQGELRFRERDSTIERQEILKRVCDDFVQTERAQWRPKNLYGLKVFLHRLMMLPTWYEQASGRYTYKKYSFEKLEPRFRGKGWAAIEAATQMRAKWVEPRQPPRMVRSVLAEAWNPFLLQAATRRLSDRVPPILASASRSLVADAAYLSGQMWQDFEQERGRSPMEGN